MNKNITVQNFNNVELGDIIFSPTSKKISNLVITYVDDKFVGASIILKEKKRNKSKNSVLIKEHDNHGYILKTYIISYEELKKHNWVVLNKQIKDLIIYPHPVKQGKVIFDYLKSNLELKFEVDQSIQRKPLNHKLEGEIKHKDYKIYSYINIIKN